MIYFTDLNPRYVKEFEIDDFEKNRDNFAKSSFEYADGYGIENALLLKKLGEDSKLFTILGGANKKTITSILEKNKIDFSHVEINDNPREEIRILNKEGLTKIFGNLPRITGQTERDLYMLTKDLKQEDYFVVTDNDQKNISDEVILNLIKLCRNNKIKVLASFKDKILLREDRVTGLVASKNQVEEFFDLKINFESEGVKLAKAMTEKLAEKAFIISDGGVLYSDGENSYKAEFDFKDKKIDKNRFLGGLALSLNRNYKDQLMLTTSLAISLSKKSIYEIEMSDIKILSSDIKIRRLKWKIIR